MQKIKGFTLVELIFVIMVISIMSVMAAPRFLNIQKDARNESLSSVQSQIESQVAMTYSKLVVAGLEGRNPDRTDPVTGSGYYGDEPDYNPFKDICGKECYFIFGTPSASATTLSSLMEGIGVGEDIVFAGYHQNDWKGEGVTGTDIVGTFSFKENVILAAKPSQNKLKSEQCYIWYSGAREDRSYKIGIVSCD
ncbi:type II secretion system protein [Vibrio sp. SCSIO 43137]|uniref:type II secretion system protein n=1 Tax=Vibrio sp. SCSIO 43137 TaxID=3021011 RepID=UPI0023070024|nr:type II secretion system protein [Vibrio sp. SCSIO 43137]WCE31431.1 type II secretion system protein [Vibrio sp. SCSIO 43137]